MRFTLVLPAAAVTLSPTAYVTIIDLAQCGVPRFVR